MRTGIPLITTIVATLLLISAGAGATLVDEQAQGQNLIAQLHAGTKTCTDLSADDLDHIGEYFMFKALGSSTLHQAINDRMTQMMGERAESRMHQLLGARYAGCSTKGLGIAGYGSMMGGGGMMGRYYNSGGSGAMMSSSDWSWMTGGTWQHMTRQDWQRLQQRMLGTNVSSSRSGDGWSTVAIIATTLGALALVGLAVFIGVRRPFRRPRAAAASQH